MNNDNKNQPPLIAHVIYRLGVGGLENGLINLINHISTDKYRHLIICLTESTCFSQRITNKEVEVIALHKKAGQDWGSFFRVYQILKQHHVDIVHTRNLGCIEYQVPAFLAGVKHRIHSEHGWDVFDPEGNNKKYQLLRRTLSPLIKVFIALSLHLQRYLQDKVKIKQEKIRTICNGVDSQKFFPVKTRAMVQGCPISINEHHVVIGTVGRMHGVKDQKTLAQAFIHLMQSQQQLLGKVYLFFIGDGPLKQEVHDLLKKNRLLDFVWLAGERTDIVEIMQSLDIFVLPSQAEGISNTILEAMASGLPVIATDVGGNSELVKNNENGLLVPASNPQALAAALHHLLADKDKRELMGEKSRHRVDNFFSIDVMVNKYTDVYDSLITKRT